MSQPVTHTPRPPRVSTPQAKSRPASRPPSAPSRRTAATLRIDSAHAKAADPVPPADHRSADKSPRATSRKHSRIQLRLSRNLVAILKAFAKAGQRPSKMVELSLWSDPQMQDAAMLLGIEPPEAIRKRRLQRIRPKSPSGTTEAS